MGFLSKIFKPVSKVLDKIIPNEAKPFLPYAAAFAPMMLGPGIMGSSMLSRGLMSGGLNIGAQLAQEGNEGDINELSALLAGGIGALTAPGTAGGKTMGVDKFDNPIISRGTPSAQNFFADRAGDTAMGEIFGGLEKGSKFLSDPGLMKYAVPVAQGTADLAYADAVRNEKDLEDSQGGGSGYGEGNQNRGLAVRRAMERGGHEEQTIQDMLESLGYEDPDPQPLASGGRVGYSLGNLVRGSGIAQPMSASMNAGDPRSTGGGSGSGIGGMVANMIGNNPQLFSTLGRSENVSIPNNDIDFIDENQNGIDDRQEKAYGGRIGFAGGGMDYMPTEPRMMGNPAVMEMIEAGDDMKENRIMNPNVEDVADYSIEFKEKTNEPNFGGIKEAIKNVDIKEEKEQLDDMGDLMAYEPGVPTTGDLYDINNPDYEGINKKVIIEFIEEGIPLGYTSPEEYFDDFYGIGSLKKNKPKKTMTAKDGGIMNGYNMGGSVLPQGMEMDYRGGGFIPMGSKERADDVPARVSKNEFVMTADAVKAAGGGSVNEGAKKMYDLMNNLEARA